ncbi:hypothetical protein [Candidatus Stoquefichus massiliensis]|uniref:hypothetical protein n=1 Tax=Candidatus Stoquefichus massiliensis TaxID=1470350 RepID=UPI000486424B|nr:hypothetical protein [Candidatus Stoquefichus massiliensis]
MKEILITALIGIIIGAIDVLPMIKMKLDKYSIISAFVFYFILPFIIVNIDFYDFVWWLKGGVVGFMLALPIIIMVAKDDKTSVPPMLIMSTVLGMIISAIQYFFM